MSTMCGTGPGRDASSGGAALGAGWGTGLFGVMVLACGVAAVAALRLGRHLPASANQIAALTAAAGPGPSPAPVGALAE